MAPSYFGGVMGLAEEKHSGERTAAIEAILEKHVLPMLQKMDGKLDELMEGKASKESVREAHERIDEVAKGLQTKADRAELAELQKTVWKWSGGIALVAVMLGWLVPFLLDKM